jgi:hypothetical protein
MASSPTEADSPGSISSFVVEQPATAQNRHKQSKNVDSFVFMVIPPEAIGLTLV